MNIVVIGAGGHARSVCDVLLMQGRHQILGLVDPEAAEGFYDLPVLGGDEVLPELLARGCAQGALVAIGSNRIRRRITEKLMDLGYEMVTAISPRAVVSPFARVEPGTVVMHGAVIGASARVGRGCIINTNCSLDHDDEVGDFCHIAPGVAISGTVRIGSESFVGTGARIIDGITLGERVMLGAGAVAIRDIPSGHTAVGVPARSIRTE